MNIGSYLLVPSAFVRGGFTSKRAVGPDCKHGASGLPLMVSSLGHKLGNLRSIRQAWNWNQKHRESCVALPPTLPNPPGPISWGGKMCAGAARPQPCPAKCHGPPLNASVAFCFGGLGGVSARSSSWFLFSRCLVFPC